jgi:hypothetical protein
MVDLFFGYTMEAAERDSDTDLVQLGPSIPTPYMSRVDPLGRLLGDMRKHVLAKIVRVNIAIISILLGNAVFAQFTKERERHSTSASSA